MRAVEESYDPEFAVRPVLKRITGTNRLYNTSTLATKTNYPEWVGKKILPVAMMMTDFTQPEVFFYGMNFNPDTAMITAKVSPRNDLAFDEYIDFEIYYYELEE